MSKIHEYKQHVEEERQSMISSALYQSMNLLRSHHAPPPLQHRHSFSPTATEGSDHEPHCAADVRVAQQDSVPSLDILNQQSAPVSPQPSCDIPMFAQNSQSLAAASAFLFSAMGSGGVQDSAIDNMPSVLRSVLKKENIDYENDFYWLTKVSFLPPFLPPTYSTLTDSIVPTGSCLQFHPLSLLFDPPIFISLLHGPSSSRGRSEVWGRPTPTESCRSWGAAPCQDQLPSRGPDASRCRHRCSSPS
jgi:hypothetical protein